MNRRRASRAAAVLATLTAVAVALSRLRLQGGRRRRPAAACSASTSMLDYLPNADHAPIYAAQATGAFKAAGPRRADPDARRPRRAAEAPRRAAGPTSRSPTSPSCCSPATRALRLASIGALVQKPLTSIIVARTARSRRRRTSKGKTVGTAGIPYQSA